MFQSIHESVCHHSQADTLWSEPEFVRESDDIGMHTFGPSLILDGVNALMA